MTRAPAAVVPEVRATTTATLAADAIAWTAVAVAVAASVLTSIANPGSSRLQAAIATRMLARGVPSGAWSLGWFGALVSAAAVRVSPFGPALLAVACALGAFVLVERRARALGAEPAARVLAVPLAALCTLDALRPGSGEAAWLFAACVSLALARPVLWNLAALGLVTVAWCNLEPEGILAPAFAFAVAAGASLETPRPERLRERWIAVAIAALACLCTPAGLAFPRLAFEALRLGDGSMGIAAVVPAVTAPHAYRFGVFALVALAFAIRTGTRGRDALPIALAFVLALANGAFVPLFGIVTAPALAAGLGRARVAAFVPPALAAVFVVAVVVVARGAPPAAAVRAPFDLAARAQTLGRGRTTLVCANIAWCDAAVAGGARVVMDGRIETADVEARTLQRTIVATGRGWREALARSGATDVLARTDSALDTLLSLSPAWHVLARVDGATLYGRVDRTIVGRPAR